MRNKTGSLSDSITPNFTRLFFMVAGSGLLFLACQSLNRTKAKDESIIEATSTNTYGETSTLKPSETHLAATITVGEDAKNSQGCAWLLQIDHPPNQVLDPINLPQEFQRVNAKVWVKFSGMRRMNRCAEASPVWVEDIVLRTE